MGESLTVSISFPFPYQVRVEGDEVYVRAQKKDLENFRRAPTACPGDVKQDPRTFLLVGGGKDFVCSAS